MSCSLTKVATRCYGATFSGTTLLVALALPRTSPWRTVTGTGGVSLNR
jgi:hypothetical protein